MTELSNFNLTEFNNLMNLANETISCGPTCVQNKKTQELEKTYLDAEANMVSAPEQLFSAKKDFITFTQGESVYNEYIDNELQKKADTIANTFQTKFNNDVNTITTNIKNYKGILINFNNVVDLYNKYRRENVDIENHLKIKSSDTLTNDRKTYYEDEGLQRLKTYYYFFLFIYVFIVVIFILSIFLVRTNVKIITRIFILILLIAYPFLCFWIIHLLHKMFTYIMSFFPNNVYKTL